MRKKHRINTVDVSQPAAHRHQPNPVSYQHAFRIKFTKLPSLEIPKFYYKFKD